MKWWGDKSVQDLNREFEKEMAAPHVERYVVSHEGRAFAFVQVCDAHADDDGWWPDATLGTWAIDYLIGEPDLIGKGLGTALIRQFSEELLARPGAHTVTADPEPDNVASIRAAEKAGFRQSGLVDTPDGIAMLMVRSCA